LHGQIDRYPERNAQDVDHRKSLVPQRVTRDMLDEKSHCWSSG
jgi:hypothetical protein